MFEIRDNIPSEIAEPLLCAGIAAFAPLFKNNISKGSKIGVVGIDGIGHMTVLFGKHPGRFWRSYMPIILSIITIMSNLMRLLRFTKDHLIFF
jgi:hypothetical protein